MSNKTKGSKNERELYQMFVENNYRAVRVAGSGVMENADCDLLAGKKGKKYCIEAKSTKKSIQYITKDQISRFLTFSEIFSLKPVIAIRFNHKGWYFLQPKHLEDSGKNYSISLKKAQLKGKRFAQFFGEKIKPSKSTTNLRATEESEALKYAKNIRAAENKEEKIKREVTNIKGAMLIKGSVFNYNDQLMDKRKIKNMAGADLFINTTKEDYNKIIDNEEE